MTQVSRRYLSPEVKSRMYEILIKGVDNARGNKQIVPFLTDLLSGPEQIMLAKRLAIAYLLIQDIYTRREMADILKVSLTTIQRVSTVLDIEGAGYRDIVNSLLRDEKVESFMDRLGDTVTGALESMTKVRGDYGARLPDPDRQRSKRIKAF